MTPSRDRIATLDIVRGVAVMGILAMNAVAFALPWPAYLNPLAFGGDSAIDLWSWFAGFVLIDGKMRGLFSLLFGGSMLLVIDRAEAAGEPAERVHFRRMGWLLGFGIVHYYLIWPGDILTLYAPLGMIAALFTQMSGRALIGCAAMLIAVQTLLLAGIAWSIEDARIAASAPGASVAAIETYRAMVTDLAIPDAATAAEMIARYQTGWTEIAAYHLSEHTFDPFFSLLIFGGEALAYMLLGMWGLRSGFLTGAWTDDRYRATAAWGMAIGLPPTALIGWLLWESGFPPALVFGLGIAAAIPFRAPMVLAFAAAAILFTRRAGALVTRIGAAGRAAFTNYLGANLLMTALFNGWGLGWYGALSRAELWLVIVPAWALMLLWSKPWLSRFQYGPFEWLWRSLARGALQPMRR